MKRWALLLFSLAACSAIVAPEKHPLRCAPIPGEGDPCPVSQHCVAGFCVSEGDTGPACTTEECNGFDDDCDGEVDEGFDSDGDKVPWCGDGAGNAMDCDDRNPQVHPAFAARGVETAAPELCDGRDNDCNGTFDDESLGAPLCPGSALCVQNRCVQRSDCFVFPCASPLVCNATVSPPRCESAMSGCTEDSCTDGRFCDRISGNCLSPRRVGSACLEDRECASDMCIPSAALGLEGMSLPTQICGEPCCGNAQCEEDELCWTSGNGGRSCLPAAMLGDPGPPWRACAKDTDCSPSQICRLSDSLNYGDRTDRHVLNCGAPIGGGRRMDTCFSADTCRTGLCLAIGECTQACHSSADCGEDYYCGYAGIESFDLVDGTTIYDYMPMCVVDPFEETGALGSACRRDTDCSDYLCIDNKCATACCANEDCAEGFQCRPHAFGDAWLMACVPNN